MKIEKPWGYEKIWAHTSNYAGKILFVKKGKRLSLQHHQQKEETLYLQKGKAIVLLEDQDGSLKEHTLQEEDSIHIACGKKHRIIAIDDSLFFEVSTPQLEDVIRHQDDYGRI